MLFVRFSDFEEVATLASCVRIRVRLEFIFAFLEVNGGKGAEVWKSVEYENSYIKKIVKCIWHAFRRYGVNSSDR